MRKDRYVIGYWPAGNCIYGKEPPEQNVSPMTLTRARRELKRLPCRGGRLFKLVPVKAQAENP